MGYALLIQDENNFTVVEHLANSVDDSVWIEDAECYEVSPEWRKAGHLIDWVKKNKPNWKVQSKIINIQDLFN